MERSSSTGRSSTRTDNESGGSGRGSVTAPTEAPDSTTVDDKRFSVSVTDNSLSGEEGSVGSSMGGAGGSVRVPKKFISTWRHACDKTKDRTRDLFKRWRTLPESGTDHSDTAAEEDDEDYQVREGVQRPTSTGSNHGWSVHVWTTWVKRYPSDEEENMLFGLENDDYGHGGDAKYLTSVQKEKLEHLFAHLFDMDRDDLISIQDFDAFSERLKHFADWTENSPEFITLQQVKDGFIHHFILSVQKTSEGEAIDQRKPLSQVISLEVWLGHWGRLLHDARNISDFPVWLQYLPKILHQAINTSGSGVISRDELSAFYSAILGLTSQNVNKLLEEAFKAMTANGEHPLTYSVYRLCFANFLLGRYPNGPGQYIFGHIGKHIDSFPIDYSAMNTPPDELERYTPDKTSNRRSVIV